MYLFDDTVTARLIAGDQEIAHKVSKLANDSWFIPATVAAELVFSLARYPQLKPALKEAVDEFLSSVQILPLDFVSLETAALIRAEAVTSEAKIPYQKACVAGLAISLGAILVSGSADYYARVENLKLDIW